MFGPDLGPNTLLRFGSMWICQCSQYLLQAFSHYIEACLIVIVILLSNKRLALVFFYVSLT